MEKRWLLRLGPPLVAVGAVGLFAASSAGTADLAGSVSDCPVVVGGAVDETAGPAWYRLDSRLDEAGALAGRRLVVGLGEDRAWGLDLPPESAAGEPVGTVVVVAADDERASEVRLVDAATGCSTVIAVEADVVRRVLLAPDGGSVYEHRVDRATRADLGVWRRDSVGGPAEPVLEPFAGEPELVRVWSTPLFWSEEGDRLLAASCDPTVCRVRWHEPLSGRRGVVPGAPAGEPIGASGQELIAFETCHDLPCAIVAINIRNGQARRLVESAGLATLAGGRGSVRLVHETEDPLRVGVVDLASGRSWTAALPDGLRLLPRAWRADAAVAGHGLAAIALAGGRPAPGTAGLRPIDLNVPAGELPR